MESTNVMVVLIKWDWANSALDAHNTDIGWLVAHLSTGNLKVFHILTCEQC